MELSCRSGLENSNLEVDVRHDARRPDLNLMLRPGCGARNRTLVSAVGAGVEHPILVSDLTDAGLAF